jgi:dystrophin
MTKASLFLQNLEEDINTHQEMFASLNENGQHMITEMEPGDVLTAVQSKLDDINDRWQSLNVRTMDMRDRLEETATEWRQLLLDLQEIIEWIKMADQDLSSQQPIGGDLEAVQTQNETHQVRIIILTEKYILIFPRFNSLFQLEA